MNEEKLVEEILTTEEEASMNPALEKILLVKTEFLIVRVLEIPCRKTILELSDDLD